MRNVPTRHRRGCLSLFTAWFQASAPRAYQVDCTGLYALFFRLQPKSRPESSNDYLPTISSPLVVSRLEKYNNADKQPTLAQLEERETVMDKIILRSPVRARQVGFILIFRVPRSFFCDPVHSKDLISQTKQTEAMVSRLVLITILMDQSITSVGWLRFMLDYVTRSCPISVESDVLRSRHKYRESRSFLAVICYQ